MTRSVFAMLSLLALGAVRFIPAQTTPPNVVYIMADELGYFELSCLGHPHIKTPRIDRMARDGLRFTQALAGSSLCAPTRATLLTGKHAGHASVRSNGGGTPLREGEPTIATVLKDAGYATGGFGKWGCGGRGSTGVPEKHGFDVFLGYYDQVHAHSYYPPYLVRNSQEVPLAGNQGGRSGKTYAHYEIFDAAKAFIRQHRERRFFCYLPVTPPHGMFDIPDQDPAWKSYADRPWPEPARRYAAMVSMLDRQVGEILDLLAELALDEETLVVFCGDNGGNDYFKDREHPRGFHGPNVDPKTGVAFRGRKGRLYEGGLRVPMIMRWPGKIAAGRVSNHVWYFPDVLPTLAELAGARVPAGVDGISIVPELLGAERAGRAQAQHRFLYWELGQQVAVRQGSLKAIRPSRKAAWELYDLATDVSESKNIATERPEALRRMQAFAKAAHSPVSSGTFSDRTLHEKDRRAKWGANGPPRRAGRGRGRRRGRVQAERLPREGLVPREKIRVVSVSSEASDNGKVAKNAIDGRPRTHWHSNWQGGATKPPHDLVLDLGATYDVTGFRYLARQDRGWNGSVARCELSVSDDPSAFGSRPMRTTLKKTRKAQEARGEPCRGRYVRFRALSEINGGPWASIAELGIIGTPAKVR